MNSGSAAETPLLAENYVRTSPQLRHLAKLLRAEALVGERPWEEWASRGGAALPGFARPDPPSATEIHHGRIAAADGEVVDPAVRDAISDAHGVLAIEREATGVGVALGRGWNPQACEHALDDRGGDAVAELEQLALDPAVAPAVTRLDIRRQQRLGGVLTNTTTPPDLYGRHFGKDRRGRVDVPVVRGGEAAVVAAGGVRSRCHRGRRRSRGGEQRGGRGSGAVADLGPVDERDHW